ncbi:Small-conductance mechanosensitive channel [Chitinispirillum alkaliphilum]|nr:Small-conductance mechanosensitive channel [Chitinispirillum alkaliphilum]
MSNFDFTIPEYLLPLAVLFLSAILLHYLFLKYLLRLVKMAGERKSARLSKIIVRRKVVNRAIHLIPATILSFGLPLIFERSTEVYINITKILSLYYIIAGYGIYEALLNVIKDIYEKYEVSKRISISGFLQAFKIIGFLLTVVFAISQLAGKSPVYFLSGLGAFTAILLLVFKDSILGLVAGVQLTTMDLVRKGDWIEMPKHGADGDVTDISLTTIRVRNFDRTVTSIPAYELVSSSFKNWRAMSEGGGRRIMRSINIDLNTIRFLTEEDLEGFRKIKLLKPYLSKKMSEIQEFNQIDCCDSDLSSLANGRRLTNIGTFRAYCTEYLRNNSGIHQELIQMVRQLQPGPQGLPLQIYVFTNNTDWKVFESIQSDIFDHFLAILPEFDLRSFQSVTGADLLRTSDNGSALRAAAATQFDRT